MIFSVGTVRNDADIVGLTARHLLAEGIDRLVLADHGSTDGTWEVLEQLRGETHQLTLVREHSPYHRQAAVVEELAAFAAKLGAGWIVPFEADVFWCALDSESADKTVAESLKALPSSYHKVYAEVIQHASWDRRASFSTGCVQVTFRYAHGLKMAEGNHDVELPGLPPGEGCSHYTLEIHEIPYRGYEHFKRKVADRLAMLPPDAPPNYASHIRRLAGLGEAEMKREWKDHVKKCGVVRNPIPTRLTGEHLERLKEICQ